MAYMNRLALVAILLWTPPAAPGLYDPEPGHLWNRIHDAIHGWQFLHHDRATDQDSLHWPAHIRDLSGEAQLSLIPLLEEFLAKKGEALVSNPLKRAILQRDLWMIFEWSVQTEHADEVWDIAKNMPVPVDREKHRALRKKIAAVMRKLAMTSEEIQALPDTLAAAAKAYPGKANPSPGDVQVPADLLDPKGPWVVMGNHAGGPLALAHHEFFEGRAAFTILLKLPDGRKATEEYIKKIGEWPFEKAGSTPECPPGTQVVLLRQSLLVSDKGYPVLSPITESFQLRYLGHARHEWKETDSLKLQLQRRKLFASEAGGLAAPQADASFVLLLGHNKEDEYSGTTKSCRECHVGPSITSLEVVIPIRRGHRALLSPATLEAETWRSTDWTFNRRSFGLLQANWPD